MNITAGSTIPLIITAISARPTHQLTSRGRRYAPRDRATCKCDEVVGALGVFGLVHATSLGLGADFLPRIFEGAPAGPLSLNRYFDTAIADGRLHGMAMHGRWITVGTPDAIPAAEAAVAGALAKAV